MSHTKLKSHQESVEQRRQCFYDSLAVKILLFTLIAIVIAGIWCKNSSCVRSSKVASSNELMPNTVLYWLMQCNPVFDVSQDASCSFNCDQQRSLCPHRPRFVWVVVMTPSHTDPTDYVEPRQTIPCTGHEHGPSNTEACSKSQNSFPPFYCMSV